MSHVSPFRNAVAMDYSYRYICSLVMNLSKSVFHNVHYLEPAMWSSYLKQTGSELFQFCLHLLPNTTQSIHLLIPESQLLVSFAEFSLEASKSLLLNTRHRAAPVSCQVVFILIQLPPTRVLPLTTITIYQLPITAWRRAASHITVCPRIILFCPASTVAIQTEEQHKYYFRIFSQKIRKEAILLRLGFIIQLTTPTVWY
jgi:hypothetical protein